MTKPDRSRKAFDRRRGVVPDVLTMVLLRWIAVAAVLLGISVFASADGTRTTDLGLDAHGAEERSKR